MSARIAARFADHRAKNRAAFIPFVMGGDPDFATSLSILRRLPAAGADLIEIGVPFTDPMADGPIIQKAGLRALKAGQTLARTLDLVEVMRKDDRDTPVILMGYCNPFLQYGRDAFLRDARAAGVDGLIVVDLPPEEDAELGAPARAAGLDFIRLATPTSDALRLAAIARNASGFVYYVSITGVTGAASPEADAIEAAVGRLRAATPLPIAVGFGVRAPAQAAMIARVADAVVVGSAIVERLAAGANGVDSAADLALRLTQDLAAAVHAARGE